MNDTTDPALNAPDHTGWLAAQGVVEISDLGRKVANILGDVYGGLYHLRDAAPGAFRRTKWAATLWIRAAVPDGLSTCDRSDLTRLVMLCHVHCVRCEIRQSGPRLLALVFHPRDRSGSIMKGHPTVEQAVAPYLEIDKAEFDEYGG